MCRGAIVSVTTQSKTDVLVVFKLGERPRHRCDGPGARTAALFRVRDGKIVLWHQTQAPPPGEPGELAGKRLDLPLLRREVEVHRGRLLRFRLQLVADAEPRLDERMLGGDAVDLLAQAPHEDVDRAIPV